MWCYGNIFVPGCHSFSPLVAKLGPIAFLNLMNTMQFRSISSAIAVSLFLSACVTAESQPDGSTRIRISAAEALGVKPANQTSAQSQTLKNQTAAQGQSQNTGANPQAAPQAPLLATTALASLFTKHPYDGTRRTYFPRVALTVVDWSRNDCWIAKAKIWWSSSKSESVPPFAVCFNKQSLNFALNNAAGMHMFFGQTSAEHSGNVRTEGPKPPMLAVPDQQPMGVDRLQSAFEPFLQQLIAETGWRGGAPTNFWIVGYNNQPVPERMASAPVATSQGKKSKQVESIEQALSCKPPSALDAAIKAFRIPTDGKQVPAPSGLTVFGLPVSKVAFARESGEALHRTYFGPGISLDQVVKAASLKANKEGGVSRSVKVQKKLWGYLSASVEDGAVVLTCSIDYEQNQYD